MPQERPTLLDRYLRHRRFWEVTMWVGGLLLGAGINSIVVLMDVERQGLQFAWWKPVTWEFSSTLVLIALLPALFAFEGRFPIRVGTWRRVLPWHLLAAAVFCLLHVL